MTVFMLVGVLVNVGKERVCEKACLKEAPSHTTLSYLHQQAPTSYHILLYTLSFGLGDTGRCWVVLECVFG